MDYQALVDRRIYGRIECFVLIYYTDMDKGISVLAHLCSHRRDSSSVDIRPKLCRPITVHVTQVNRSSLKIRAHHTDIY